MQYLTECVVSDISLVVLDYLMIDEPIMEEALEYLSKRVKVRRLWHSHALNADQERYTRAHILLKRPLPRAITSNLGCCRQMSIDLRIQLYLTYADILNPIQLYKEILLMDWHISPPDRVRLINRLVSLPALTLEQAQQMIDGTYKDDIIVPLLVRFNLTLSYRHFKEIISYATKVDIRCVDMLERKLTREQTQECLLTSLHRGRLDLVRRLCKEDIAPVAPSAQQDLLNMALLKLPQAVNLILSVQSPYTEPYRGWGMISP